jgi:transposase InsO family protein
LEERGSWSIQFDPPPLSWTPELTEHENYASRATAAASIADYIETFYNLQRRHSFLDYVSPIEFELKTRCTPLAA